MLCLQERDLGEMADTLRKKRGLWVKMPLVKEENEDYNHGETEKIWIGQILDIWIKQSTNRRRKFRKRSNLLTPPKMRTYRTGGRGCYWRTHQGIVGIRLQMSSRDLSKVLLPASILRNDGCAAKKLEWKCGQFWAWVGHTTVCPSICMSWLAGSEAPAWDSGCRGRGWGGQPGVWSRMPGDLASDPLGWAVYKPGLKVQAAPGTNPFLPFLGTWCGLRLEGAVGIPQRRECPSWEQVRATGDVPEGAGAGGGECCLWVRVSLCCLWTFLLFFKLYIYWLIFLCQILVVAGGIWFSNQELNPGSLHWEQSPSHWTTKEVPPCTSAYGKGVRFEVGGACCGQVEGCGSGLEEQEDSVMWPQWYPQSCWHWDIHGILSRPPNKLVSDH